MLRAPNEPPPAPAPGPIVVPAPDHAPGESRLPPPRLRRPVVRADERAVGYRAHATGATSSPVRLVAFYARDPDWAEVTRALPQFDGHAQPRLPGELGFYHSSPETLRRQVALAKEYGITAFCFRQGAEALDVFLADPTLDFAFCVESAADVERASADPRYLRIDGERIEPIIDSASSVTSRQHLLNPMYRGLVIDVRDVMHASAGRPGIPIVSCGLDDEPMDPGRGRVFALASPRQYGDWLRKAVATSEVVFIDSWNDWRRGAVLEPDARLGHAYLAATRSALCEVVRDSRPCAVVHVYYVELLDEIVTALKASGLEFRLIVTTPHDRADKVRARLRELEMNAEVEAHENRGRDILPFLRVANRLLDEGVDCVLKLHTKHSGHRVDGHHWRAELIGRLVESSRAKTIVETFRRDPNLGCVAPEGHVLPLSVYWGSNEATVRYLCVRMGLRDPDVAGDSFAAGSMFWIRLAALRPLLDAHLGEWEFEAEGGYVDGTIAHAIERVIMLAAIGAGFRMETAAAICGVPYQDNVRYAYAEPSHPPAT